MRSQAATTADIPSIAALWHQGWHQGHGDIAPSALVASRQMPEFLTRVEAHLPQTHVLYQEGQLAGFFMIEGEEIYQFYVAETFQGSGVARHLMAEAEAVLAGKQAWLACSVGNMRAARFYEKSGWQRGATQAYEVETATGPQVVDIWRFEKDLR